ncbi:MAG: GTPase Era [Oscillospiraceae bacterium]|jgi:GTP-binding protein Era|nr:GTPase Era [Oscillospiraceae bacterium]
MSSPEKAVFRSGFAAIIGRPNVGKSSLMNAMVGEKVAIVSDRPQTTRNRIMGVADGGDWQLVFLDTPGLHKARTRLGEYMVKAARDALDGIDILLVLADVTHIGEQDRELVAEMAARSVTKVLVLNKIDVVGEERLLSVIQSFAQTGYDHIVPISALTGRGLDELQRVLVAALPQGPRYFPPDMVTDQPERLVCAEIIREKALHRLREEVPHGIGVEMLAMTRLSENLMEIHATIYCDRASHKGIIIGKHGAMLGAIGTAARADIENLLGMHVALKLWVKVREDWRNRQDDLRTLGYE